MQTTAADRPSSGRSAALFIASIIGNLKPAAEGRRSGSRQLRARFSRLEVYSAGMTMRAGLLSFVPNISTPSSRRGCIEPGEPRSQLPGPRSPCLRYGTAALAISASIDIPGAASHRVYQLAVDQKAAFVHNGPMEDFDAERIHNGGRRRRPRKTQTAGQ